MFSFLIYGISNPIEITASLDLTPTETNNAVTFVCKTFIQRTWNENPSETTVGISYIYGQ